MRGRSSSTPACRTARSIRSAIIAVHGASFTPPPHRRWRNPTPAVTARGTMMLGVPAMYQLLLEYAKQKGLPSIAHPALRNLSSCGAPLDPALKSSVERMFGMALHNGYGITECSPTIAQTRIEAPPTDCTVG